MPLGDGLHTPEGLSAAQAGSHTSERFSTLAAKADCLGPRLGIRLQTLQGCCCAGVATYVKERFSPLAAQADCLDGGESDLDREGRRAP